MTLILVPCASGVATSTMVSEKLKTLCRRRNLDVEVRPVSFKSLESLRSTADLVVTLTPYAGGDDAGVLNGLPLLTGVGLNKLLDQIESRIGTREKPA